MTEHSAHAIALPELVRVCQRETRRYQHGDNSDPAYCLELFRRALQQVGITASDLSTTTIYKDNAARDALVSLYTEYVRAHIHRMAVRREHIEEIVQEVWRNFWQAANKGLHFEQLSHALAYLRQVTLSQVIRYRRIQQQMLREASIQELLELYGHDLASTPIDALFTMHAQERFQQRCAELMSAFEWRVFTMRYALGYKPKIIAQHLNDQEAQANYSARTISDLLEQLFRRLSADDEIRDLLQDD